jgi:hypothetical protein
VQADAPDTGRPPALPRAHTPARPPATHARASPHSPAACSTTSTSSSSRHRQRMLRCGPMRGWHLRAAQLASSAARLVCVAASEACALLCALCCVADLYRTCVH